MNRIAILIDGNNFYKGCLLNFNRTDVDFRKLGQKLGQEIEGQLLRIYYYNAHVSKTIDPLGYQRQQKFFDNLRATPFITLKLGHLVYHRLRNEQGFSSQYFPTEKGIDVQIAVDMIRLSMLKSCEGVVLVSGDSDYIYAVRFAKDLGTTVYVASFPMGGSNDLRNEGDGSILMDLDFIKDCFIRQVQYTTAHHEGPRDSRVVDTEPTFPDRYPQQSRPQYGRYDRYDRQGRYDKYNRQGRYERPGEGGIEAQERIVDEEQVYDQYQTGYDPLSEIGAKPDLPEQVEKQDSSDEGSAPPPSPPDDSPKEDKEDTETSV